MSDLINTNGYAVMRHILKSSVKISDGIGRPCFRGNCKHTGLLSQKSLIGQRRICFIKSHMAVNADSSKGNIHASQLFNQFWDPFRIKRIRKYPLFFGHHKLWAYPVIYGTVHKAPKAQRMILRHPALLIIQIFVHIDKPYIFKTDILLIYQIHKIRILSHRPYRTDKDGVLSLCIMSFDLFCHLLCHLFKYSSIILQAKQLHFWIFQKLLFCIAVIVVFHNCSFPCHAGPSAIFPP